MAEMRPSEHIGGICAPFLFESIQSLIMSLKTIESLVKSLHAHLGQESEKFITLALAFQ